MCGRYSFTSPPEAMRRLFAFAGPIPNLAPRYNIAPTQQAPVIRLAKTGGDGARDLAMMRWGLIPGWSKGPDTRFSMINARAETVAEKPAYRGAYRHRRCLVPADGFYEWQKRDGSKQPWRITVTDQEVFAFAGLWESWHGDDGTPAIPSFTILTTSANDLLRPIHDRMPTILHAADHQRWLAGAEPAALLAPYPSTPMATLAIGARINSPRHDDPACITPLDTSPDPSGAPGI